jgi:hypothetical protein
MLLLSLTTDKLMSKHVVISALLNHIKAIPTHTPAPAPALLYPTTSSNREAVPQGGLKFCEPQVFDGKVRSVNQGLYTPPPIPIGLLRLLGQS